MASKLEAKMLGGGDEGGLGRCCGGSWYARKAAAELRASVELLMLWGLGDGAV